MSRSTTRRRRRARSASPMRSWHCASGFHCRIRRFGRAWPPRCELSTLRSAGAAVLPKMRIDKFVPPLLWASMSPFGGKAPSCNLAAVSVGNLRRVSVSAVSSDHTSTACSCAPCGASRKESSMRVRQIPRSPDLNLTALYNLPSACPLRGACRTPAPVRPLGFDLRIRRSWRR